MPDANLGAADIPGLCPCGHDEAYHYRQVLKGMPDGSVALASGTGCTTCTCQKYGMEGKFVGFGALAPKEWGNR